MTTTEPMAASQPLAGHNAIEAATFAVALNGMIDAARMEAFRRALNTFADELPGQQNPGQQAGIVISFGPVQPPNDAVRFLSKPNGAHSWRVHCTGNVLQVSCFEYTRFDEVWGRAMRYLRALLNAGGQDTQVIELVHHYVDRFEYPDHMPPSQYRAVELFQPNTPYLTPQCWNSGLLWHVYQGWFVDHGKPQRMLHQLNVSNTEVSATQVATLIEHRCSLQWMLANAPSATQSTEVNDSGVCPLDTGMRQLHAAHKQVFKALVQPAKQQQIGMVA